MKNSRLLASTALVAASLAGLGLPAQSPKVPQPIQDQSDFKPDRKADPRKGYGEVTTLTAEERTPARRPHADGPVVQQILNDRMAGVDPNAVYWSAAADGRTWAGGATYKASFGADGFTYVPFLGSKAPRNFPVQFTIAAVKAGGADVAFAREVAPVRTGDRIVFDRGAVREIYEVRARGIEQTFEVAGALPGDVVVELAVASELTEDAASAGLQFVNALGGVDYGTAYVVDGTDKREIASSFANGHVSLRVPAAMRAATGAVVIDPVISTQNTSSTSSYDFDNPDVAFDASYLRYLVVWQRNYSATDVDVWCEMRDVNGAYVANSAQYVDNSGDHWSVPRVANLNAYNRFLVVAEKYVAANPVGQRWTVWGRTVEAVSPFTVGSAFEVSGAQSGDKRNPDVGGDPNLALPTYWTVAYTRELSATDHDIHARQVQDNATMRPGTILVENSSNTIYRDVQISQSNGDLSSTDQRWLLVYSYKYGATDWDVYGASLSWDGIIKQVSTGIETASINHVAPQVSSATSQVTGSPLFGVAFDVFNVQGSMRVKIVDGGLLTVVATTNVSQLLGLSGQYTYFPHIESDGTRFALTYALGQPAYATTLAVIGSSLVVQESPQLIGSGIDAFDLNIVSRASAGGSNTGYGIVMTDENATPHKVVFATYEGHAPNGGFTIRPTGCNNLGISASGSAMLGRTVSATLTGVGSDLKGMLIGVPGPAIPLCSNCMLGINLGGAYINLANLSSLNLPIPSQTHLVGLTITIQGYAAGSGPCMALLRLSNSLDVKIQ